MEHKGAHIIDVEQSRRKPAERGACFAGRYLTRVTRFISPSALDWNLRFAAVRVSLLELLSHSLSDRALSQAIADALELIDG